MLELMSWLLMHALLGKHTAKWEFCMGTTFTLTT
jgi:hypothetical protein